jgi:hypothetical protein
MHFDQQRLARARVEHVLRADEPVQLKLREWPQRPRK